MFRRSSFASAIVGNAGATMVAGATLVLQVRMRRCEPFSAEANSLDLSEVRTCDEFSAGAQPQMRQKGHKCDLTGRKMGNLRVSIHNSFWDFGSSVGDEISRDFQKEH